MPDLREIAHHMQRAFEALKALPLPVVTAAAEPAALPAPVKRRTAPRKTKLVVVPAAPPAKTRRARAA